MGHGTTNDPHILLIRNTYGTIVEAPLTPEIVVCTSASDGAGELLSDLFSFFDFLSDWGSSPKNFPSLVSMQ